MQPDQRARCLDLTLAERAARAGAVPTPAVPVARLKRPPARARAVRQASRVLRLRRAAAMVTEPRQGPALAPWRADRAEPALAPPRAVRVHPGPRAPLETRVRRS